MNFRNFTVISALFLMIPLQAFSATAPVAAVSADSSAKSATELPTRRKIPTSRAIEVRRDETDRQIRVRLEKIIRTQEIFRNAEVEVVEGIVTLRGKLEEQGSAKSLSALAEKIEGVIGVIDRTEVIDTKKTGLRLAQSEVTALIQKFFRFLPYLATSLVILLITFLVSGFTFRAWRAVLRRRMPRRPLFAHNLAKILTVPVFVLGIYLILEVGGMTGLAATVVGGTGMFGIILGLAGKNILADYLSSFMLTLRNPFKVGDYVSIGDVSGIVHKVDSRCTMLLNSDGVFTQIPNSVVLNSTIRNHSSHPLNRDSFKWHLDREEDVEEFLRTFASAVRAQGEAIAADPKPEAVVTEITKTEVTLLCTFWVNTHAQNLARVKSSLLRTLLVSWTTGSERQAAIVSAPTSKATVSERDILRARASAIHLPQTQPLKS